MRRTSWQAVSLVLVLSLALLSCDGPSRGTNTQPSAASGFQIVVTASPNVIPAANGTTIVQVKVFDTSGRLVDGARVVVSPSLSNISSPAASGTTIRGIFTATFSAQNARPGTVIITAVVEDAVATTTLTLF